IDEEHRFGVRDKQRLQALRANVHVLTLTATPIPRTLNMALGGLRDLSLITTAPAARLAIKTFLIEWHAPTLREAALRELRRGRVGRSHHRAYAYLIAPPRQGLARDAVKRLEAIESMEELGAGFVLATHDLEIRGAGELLGEQQSGQVTEIGLSLYLDMLEHAVRALKAGREPVLDQPLAAATEVELRLPAFLPEVYVGDVHMRLSLYKRIAAADSDAALDELSAEIHDRFGPLPPAAQSLLRIARLKLTARTLGVRRLD